MLIRLLLVLVVIAVLIDVIAGLFETEQLAFEAAEAAYRERGMQLDEVNGRKTVVSGTFLGKTAEVQFKGRRQNSPASVLVALRKPIDLMAWQVVDVREKTGD